MIDIITNIDTHPTSYFVDVLNRYAFESSTLTKFYRTLVAKRKYNELFEIVTHTTYRIDSSQYVQPLDIHSPYSTQFAYLKDTLLNVSQMDNEQRKEFYLMLFWVFHIENIEHSTTPQSNFSNKYTLTIPNIPNHESIIGFLPAIKNFLFLIAVDDFDNYLQLVKQFDTSFKTIEIAIRADKNRAIAFLIECYFSGIQSAKRILSHYIDDVLLYYAQNQHSIQKPILNDQENSFQDDSLTIPQSTHNTIAQYTHQLPQKSLTAQQKTKLIRLLGMYRDAISIKNSLQELLAVETNQTARRLLQNIIDRVSNQSNAQISQSQPFPTRETQQKVRIQFYSTNPKYSFDQNGVCCFDGEFGLAKYTLDDKFCVKCIEKPQNIKRKKSYTEFEKSLSRFVTSSIKQMEKAMCSNLLISLESFLQNIQNDYFFAKISELLVFGLLQTDKFLFGSSQLPELILVHDQELINIHNQPIALAETHHQQVCIMHPVYFHNNAYNAILHQKIEQPFEQIQRAVYFVNERHKNSTTINLYDHRIIHTIALQNAKILQFYPSKSLVTFPINLIYCKMDLAYLDQNTCKITSISFFNRNQSRLIRNDYFFTQSPLTLASIDKPTYSEAIRIIQSIVD